MSKTQKIVEGLVREFYKKQGWLRWLFRIVLETIVANIIFAFLGSGVAVCLLGPRNFALFIKSSVQPMMMATVIGLTTAFLACIQYELVVNYIKRKNEAVVGDQLDITGRKKKTWPLLGAYILIGIMFCMFAIRGAAETAGINLFPVVASSTEWMNTPNISSTDTPSQMPTLTPTISPTLTITPEVTDEFVVDDGHWQLPNDWGPNVTSAIAGEKLNISVYCSPNFDLAVCEPYVKLIRPSLEDFTLSFDLTFEEASSGSNPTVKIRLLHDAYSYYSFDVNLLGDYYLKLSSQGKITNLFQDMTQVLPIPIELKTPITIRIVSDDRYYTVYENDRLIVPKVMDKNVSLPGKLLIYFSVKKYESASFSLKHFRLYGEP